MENTGDPRLFGQLLHWPVRKQSRSFRAFVVEPTRYDPRTHAAIYMETLNALTTPATRRLDTHDSLIAPSLVEQFDLLTFPEAFLAPPALLESLNQVSALGSFGCVHVGLRPSTDDHSHLFGVDDFQRLMDHLMGIPRIHREDLTPLASWLSGQTGDLRFNLGCLFAVDANCELRVCLHPKMVRSRFELSPSAERNMTEANVLTLVTLVPEDKRFLSVTLQPLLCSDALDLPTDVPGQLPLECANTRAECFPLSPPDHVDLLMVANCTPQPEGLRTDGSRYRQWHQEFRDTFKRIGEGLLPRHGHSGVVLSNFRNLQRDAGPASSPVPGGLSGVFLPIPFHGAAPHESDALPVYVQATSFGKDDDDAIDNDWSIPDHRPNPKRRTKGHILQLDPYDERVSQALLLGFTITRFPRDDSRWRPQARIVNFQLRNAINDDASPTGLKFERRNP